MYKMLVKPDKKQIPIGFWHEKCRISPTGMIKIVKKRFPLSDEQQLTIFGKSPHLVVNDKFQFVNMVTNLF